MATPTKKCEICGEDVPNLKYKKHVEAHSESEVKEQVQDVAVQPEPKKQDKPVADPEMAALIKSAMAAQEKILEVPDVFFGEDSTNQHAALVRVHCPETLGENPEYTAVFGDARKRLDGYTAKAYIPVLDEKGSLVRDEGGNPMFTVRKEIYDGRKQVFQQESSRRLHNVTSDAKEKNASQGLTQEELTIEKT